MKLLCLVFFAVVVFNVFPSQVECWIGFQRDSRKNHSGHCFETIHGLGPLESNEIRRIDSMCKIAQCQPDKNIRYSGCPIVHTAANCSITEGDLSKNYPDCCVSIECYEEDATETNSINQDVSGEEEETSANSNTTDSTENS